MRFFIDVIFLASFLILGIPAYLVLCLLGKVEKWKYKTDLIALRIVQWAFKCMLFIAGTKTIVIGEEHVPKDQPVLYIPNHRSYFDILLLYSRVPGLTGFVSKDSMKKFYLLRDWMKKLYCLFLNRENPREGLKTILQGTFLTKKHANSSSISTKTSLTNKYASSLVFLIATCSRSKGATSMFTALLLTMCLALPTKMC